MGSYPAKYKPGQELTVYAAAADITGGRFVKLTGNVTADDDYSGGHAGAGEFAVGVAQNDAEYTLPAHAQGRRSNVATGGVAFVETGGAITAWTEVQSDASGKAVTKTTGVALGIALKTAADASLVEVLLYGAATPGLATTGNAFAQGTQASAIVDVAAFTDPPSAAEMTALRTKVNSILAALREYGIIAT